MTLPFQKLPYLVIQVILQTMGFLDLFLLSCTSSKTKRIVRNVFKIRNHNLYAIADRSLLLKIQSGTDQNYIESIFVSSKKELPYLTSEEAEKVFHVNIGSAGRVPSDYQEAEDDSIFLETYWKSPRIGLKVIYEALFEIFGVTVSQVRINLDEVQSHEKTATNWIKHTFLVVPTFSVVGRCSFPNYIWLIKNIRAKDVFFLMEPTEYPENLETIYFEVKTIQIKHGRWMKLQDVQAIQAQIIAIGDVSLTDSEINIFLRNLKDLKEKSLLKQLNIDFYRESNLGIVLEGLEATNEDLMMPEDSLNQRSFEFVNGQKCTVIYIEYDNEPSDVEMFGFEVRIED